MNIEDIYNLDKLLKEAEVALQISGTDYEEKDFGIILRNIRDRLGLQYQIDLTDKNINDDSFNVSIYQSSISLLIDNMAMIHSKFAGYTQIVHYEFKSDINLSNVNYLGFTKDTVMTSLRLAQMRKTQPRILNFVESIKPKMYTIKHCKEKRLFVLFIVSYELGLNAFTATLAEILYIGGRFEQ